jgi:hypothetical protein
LTTKIYWMLASTVQFSRYGRQRPRWSPRTPGGEPFGVEGGPSTQAHLRTGGPKVFARTNPRSRTFRTQQRAGRRPDQCAFHPVETGVLARRRSDTHSTMIHP